jgi:hypothetical protein
LSTNSSTARGRIDLLERQIREIEALTEDVQAGALARLKAELARLQQAVTVSGRREMRTVFDRL